MREARAGGGDGRVSRQEFDGPPDQFEVPDANHDGYLSENEAPHRMGQPGVGRWRGCAGAPGHI